MDEQRKVEIHLEKGGISLENTRLVNQSILGLLFPDLFPQLILPAQDGLINEFSFPVEKLDIDLMDFVSQPWNDESDRVFFPIFKLLKSKLRNKENEVKKYPTISVQDLENIYLTIYKEVMLVFHQKGIILLDRNPKNILLRRTNQKKENTVIVGNEMFAVKQADLSNVYDALTNKLFLDNDIDFESRNDATVSSFIDYEKTEEYLFSVIFEMAQGFHLLLCKIRGVNAKRLSENQVRNWIISNFSKDAINCDEYIFAKLLNQLNRNIVK